jgi:hypothetical protein
MLADEKAHFTFTLRVKASLAVFSEKKKASVPSLGGATFMNRGDTKSQIA